MFPSQTNTVIRMFLGAAGMHGYISYDAEVTFAQSTRVQRSLKTILTLSCWYSLDSSHRVLSDEYPYAWVLVIFQGFLPRFLLAELATSSTRVN